MIEIIQQNEQEPETKEENHLPRNIRQIGNPEKDFRIYMEDYVYTFLHPVRTPEFQAAKIQKTLGSDGESPIDAEEKKHRMIILLGDIETYAHRKCAFISGAMQILVTSQENGLPDFTEQDYEEIKAQQKLYFPTLEMVGWVLDQPGCTSSLSPEVQRVHADYMGEKAPFLFLMDSIEREETFYIYKEGSLQRKDGYFIYYEKNPDMQEYMVSRYQAEHKQKQEHYNDQAARNYRSHMQASQEKKNKRYRIATCVFGAAMTIGVCTICILVMGSLRKIESVEAAVAGLTGKSEAQSLKPADSLLQSTVGNIIAETETDALLTQQNSDGIEEADSASNGVRVEEVEGGVVPTEEKADTKAEDETEKSKQQEGGKASAEDGQAGDGDQSDAGDQPQGDSQELWGSQSAAEQPLTWAEQCLAQGYYVVQKGDSLEKISTSIYQTDAMIDKLCEVNHIDNPDDITEGQRLELP